MDKIRLPREKLLENKLKDHMLAVDGFVISHYVHAVKINDNFFERRFGQNCLLCSLSLFTSNSPGNWGSQLGQLIAFI